LAEARKRVNTKFDITDQMLSLSPLSYNQYQVLQQTCFHILNFNELLLIEDFVKNFFKNLVFYLDEERNPHPVYANDLFRSVGRPPFKKDEAGILLEPESSCAVDQLLRRTELLKEALTAPSAGREYDYERLEFYGDSIVGFLVILELFLTEKDMQEGDLDHMRIRQVSNLNFYKVSKEKGFYHYMIIERMHIFSGFQPCGFGDELNY